MRTLDLLAIAAWFALVTGLLEGLARTALQGLGGVAWDLLLSGTSVKIIWIAPLLYLVLFSAGGIFLAAVSAAAPRLPILKIAVFLFGLAGFADVLSSSGRVSAVGIVMLALGLAVVMLRWFASHENAAVRFWKRSLPWLAAGVLVAFAGIESGIRIAERRAIAALPPAAPGAPNVLIIVVDTLRADQLSLYGYKRKTSPHLERIAQDSVVFENALATSPWTLPSHASMLTGLYPTEHGAEKFPLGRRHPVVSEVLQARGYRTGAFSANTLFFARAQGFGRGFIHFSDYFQNFPDAASRTMLGKYLFKFVLRRLGQSTEIIGRQLAEEINEKALAWVGNDRSRPFFAVLNYMDTHIPYDPPAPYANAFSNKKNPGGKFNIEIENFPMRDMPADVVPDGIAAYDGATLYVDAQIGRLLGELEKQELAENTIVIITSDHGEMLGEHGDFGHAHSMWAPTLYVPLIMRWPGKIPAGKRVATQVSLASLPATVMSLLGGSPQPFPGPSLAVLWAEASPPGDWPYPWAELAACPERNRPRIPCHNGALKVITNADWYFIFHEKQLPQLFDAKKDRAQLNNLAETPQGRPVVEDFLARVRGKQMRAGASAKNLAAGGEN